MKLDQGVLAVLQCQVTLKISLLVALSAALCVHTLRASSVLFHLLKTGLTAVCGSKLGYCVQWFLALLVVRLTGR